MFFDINKTLCEDYGGLDPIKLLNYPAEDVFDLIKNTIRYNSKKKKQSKKETVIRKPAGNNWF